jgi:hypothetical protein
MSHQRNSIDINKKLGSSWVQVDNTVYFTEWSIAKLFTLTKRKMKSQSLACPSRLSGCQDSREGDSGHAIRFFEPHGAGVQSAI